MNGLHGFGVYFGESWILKISLFMLADGEWCLGRNAPGAARGRDFLGGGFQGGKGLPALILMGLYGVLVVDEQLFQDVHLGVLGLVDAAFDGNGAVFPAQFIVAAVITKAIRSVRGVQLGRCVH